MSWSSKKDLPSPATRLYQVCSTRYFVGIRGCVSSSSSGATSLNIASRLKSVSVFEMDVGCGVNGTFYWTCAATHHKETGIFGQNFIRQLLTCQKLAREFNPYNFIWKHPDEVPPHSLWNKIIFSKKISFTKNHPPPKILGIPVQPAGWGSRVLLKGHAPTNLCTSCSVVGVAEKNGRAPGCHHTSVSSDASVYKSSQNFNKLHSLQDLQGGSTLWW